MVINSQWSLGAQIVGVNCHFDPMTCVKAVKMMKEGVEKAGLKAHYMVQPLAFHTPDCNCQGFIDLPEFPFGNKFFACTLKERKKRHLSMQLFTFLLSPSVLSPGTQDSDPMGYAQVRKRGLQGWHPIHWRLLWVWAVPHQGCGRGAGLWERNNAPWIRETWNVGFWSGNAHQTLGQSQVKHLRTPNTLRFTCF